ncbi:MAG: Asp23/Gls24 family envelope stress response protein [Eubacteriales bacterium]
MSTENKEVKEMAVVDDSGKVTYANDVIAKIAALAAGEVKGILGTEGGSIQEMLGVKNLTKGLKVTVANGEVTVDLNVVVEYGALIHKVCAEVQDNIIKAVESMTDLKVAKVDVHVGSIKMLNAKE